MFPGEDSVRNMARREGYEAGWRAGYKAAIFAVFLVVGLGVLAWFGLVQ